jgi:hypothetical protein
LATVFWNPTLAPVAETDTLTVAGTPALNNTISAVVGVAPNTSTITYTLSGADTAITAAASLFALIEASLSAMFGEITFSYVAGSAVITATASTPGVPFTLASSATGGGATITHAVVTANVSPSDVNAAANWSRSGAQSLPQNGDDVVIQDSAVPLLWNLGSLSAVTFNSLTRWQSFTGTIGLPEFNGNNYVEYRPTYFKFGVNASPINVNLGVGVLGSGPSRERYDAGTNQITWNVLNSGSPADDYAVRILNVNASSTLAVQNTSVGVAMQPGEVSTLASAKVDGGGSISLGSGVTITTASLNGAIGYVNTPCTVTASNGSQLTVQSEGGTFAAVTLQGGSNCQWLSDSTITTLKVQTGSTFDKSGDLRSVTVTNSTVDGDTTQVLDPNSSISWTNATNVTNQVTSGPFTFGAGRTIKIV